LGTIGISAATSGDGVKIAQVAAQVTAGGVLLPDHEPRSPKVVLATGARVRF